MKAYDAESARCMELWLPLMDISCCDKKSMFEYVYQLGFVDGRIAAAREPQSSIVNLVVEGGKKREQT
jgi:hypothetical protein